MEHKEEKNNTKKSGVVVSLSGDKWEVKTEGDSAVLFSSSEKEAAVDFAKEMAKKHGVELKVYDEKTRPKSSFILVSCEDGQWLVRNENDTAILFSSAQKDAALKFANQMGKEHELEIRIGNG